MFLIVTMFQRLNIKNKLKVNVAVVLIGLAIVVANIYFSLDNIENEFETVKVTQEKTSALKSMLIGGLMFNSAKGVIYTSALNSHKSKKAQKTS